MDVLYLQGRERERTSVLKKEWMFLLKLLIDLENLLIDTSTNVRLKPGLYASKIKKIWQEIHE